MATTTETAIAPENATLKLRSPAEATTTAATTIQQQGTEKYKYAHLLPVFTHDHYEPLQPFDHVDPGLRALNHPNPRSFLDNATVVELTPGLGSEVRGVNLATLDSDGRDQIALEVCNLFPPLSLGLIRTQGRAPRHRSLQRSARLHRQRTRLLSRVGETLWPVRNHVQFRPVLSPY